MRFLNRGVHWRFCATIAALVLGLVYTPRTRAATILDLTTSTGASVQIVDNGLGDANPAVNVVTFIGAVGGWILNVSTVFSKNYAAPALMDLNSVSIAGVNAGSLTIMGSDNDFDAMQDLRFAVGGTMQPGWSSAFSAYGGSSNTLSDLSNQIGSTLAFNSSVYSGETQGGVPSVTPYSLTIVAVLDSANQAGSASFDTAIVPVPVPEPASASFVGGGLLVAAWFASTRRKRSTPKC